MLHLFVPLKPMACSFLLLPLLCLPVQADLLDRTKRLFDTPVFNSPTRFLPAEQAFSLTLVEAQAFYAGQLTSPDTPTLILQWQIAPGYYLYRHQFSMEPLNPQNFQLGAVQLPPGQHKSDPFQGEIEAYYDRVTAIIPVTVVAPKTTAIPAPDNTESTQPLEVSIRYQGCAQAGFCYPPETKTLVVDFAKLRHNQ